MISSYSHGMKQKLALISAFIRNPKLLILDEPFVGLDPKASFKVKEIMKDMCEKGSIIFFSTHVLEVAEKLCDKVAIIKNASRSIYKQAWNNEKQEHLKNEVEILIKEIEDIK